MDRMVPMLSVGRFSWLFNHGEVGMMVVFRRNASNALATHGKEQH